MNTTRRGFVKGAALAGFGIGMAPAWLTRAAYAESSNRRKVLVVIFQRGAMDGLNVVVPYGEDRYVELRPTLALKKPGATGGEVLVDLDGFFGLHPALQPLMPLWSEKQVAIVQAAGSPDATRSHFDAQDYMESGTPGRKSTSDGWLNRVLAKEAKPSPIRAVSMGGTLARALRGPNSAVALNSLSSFNVRDNTREQFAAMYSQSTDTVLQGMGRETFEAIQLVEGINKQKYTAANGAVYPGSRLGQSLLQIARLIKAGAGLQVAFADSTGWDTHVGQSGALQGLLSDFGSSLAAFVKDMGEGMQDVTVVSMSEFGRTAKENGTRGTDHGHANVMFAVGAGVVGGKVHGQWPGLGVEQLYEKRDLAVTTDFRSVLSEVVTQQLGVAKIAAVFPEFKPAKVGVISST